MLADFITIDPPETSPQETSRLGLSDVLPFRAHVNNVVVGGCDVVSK